MGECVKLCMCHLATLSWLDDVATSDVSKSAPSASPPCYITSWRICTCAASYSWPFDPVWPSVVVVGRIQLCQCRCCDFFMLKSRTTAWPGWFETRFCWLQFESFASLPKFDLPKQNWADRGTNYINGSMDTASRKLYGVSRWNKI